MSKRCCYISNAPPKYNDWQLREKYIVCMQKSLGCLAKVAMLKILNISEVSINSSNSS